MLRRMRWVRRSAIGFGVCLGLCACASAPAPATSATDARNAAPSPVAVPSAAISRELGNDATFGDLLRTARVLIRSRQAASSDGCVLRREATGYALSADLMPALDELPDTPAELDSQLQRATGPTRVLTPFGPVGQAEPALVLGAFSAVVPDAARLPAVALVLTDEGVYLRYGNTHAGAADGPLPIEAAVARLLAEPGNAQAILYVSAEAAVRVADLAQLLRLLPADHAVALAIALPQGTTLPVARAIAPAVQTCPEGLPEVPADSAEGDLDAQAVVAALPPLRAAAQDCLDSAFGAARAGGRIALALRVAPDGSVADACVMKDAIGDAALAACVLSSALGLHFPRPAPPGVVDVHLPLVLTPAGPVAQRALCE
jgi:hypothetical protein